MAEVSVFDLITFTDVFESTTKIGTLNDVINFPDSVDSHHDFETVTDRVQLSDAIAVAPGRVINCTLSDTMVLDDEVWPMYEPISDVLLLVDWLEIPNGLLYETLTLTDTFTGVAGPSISDTIELTDLITYTAVIISPANDTITLVDAFTGFVNDPWHPVVPIPGERS